MHLFNLSENFLVPEKMNYADPAFLIGGVKHMAVIPGTASTFSDMDVTALRRIAWKSKSKEDSVRPSIFTAVKTIYKVLKDEIIITKHGILLDVSNVGKDRQSGGQTVRCALRTPLRDAPQEGTANDMLGNEDETDYLYTTFYYNEIKKAVKFNTWGYDYNDSEYLNHNEGYSSFVGLFWQELNDHRYQTALLLGFSNELTQQPVNQVQTFNPNWAVPNLEPASYPVWDTDAITATDGAVDSEGWYPNRAFSGTTTFVENIATALLAASGTGGTSNATLTVDAIYEICDYIVDQHVVEPLTMARGSYIWKMPSRVIMWMLNPNNAGSLGTYWQEVAAYQDDKPMLPGEVGMLANMFRVCMDLRCPTLTVSGSSGSYTLTPGWIRPGNNDDRNNGAWSNASGNTNYSFDMTTILGAEALGQYTRDDLQTDLIETTEYKKREGRGSYYGDGVSIPRFDKGTETDTSQIYRGSIIVPVSRVRVASS